MTYFRDNIEAMSAYVPGEQPPPGAKVIKLNTNENPYPPAPAAMAILRDFDADLLRRYPHPLAERFRLRVAEVLGVPVDWVLSGNGSDDLVTMIGRACAGPGRPVAYAVPTFEFYITQAQIQAAKRVEADYDEQYNLPVDELLAAEPAVTFVASPNSPSGTAVPRQQLGRLASGLSGVLVIDEAYVDFADGDALELVRRHENVLVLRTLSKGYSLAGLRLGYAVANPGLLAGLMKVKDIYNVSAVACAVGAAAMEDQAHKAANAEKVKASREALRGQLQRLGFNVWPSQANFLLARPPEGDAEGLYEALKARGILVRYFKHRRLVDKLRITVGTDEQNAALVGALSDLLAKT